MLLYNIKAFTRTFEVYIHLLRISGLIFSIIVYLSENQLIEPVADNKSIRPHIEMVREILAMHHKEVTSVYFT